MCIVLQNQRNAHHICNYMTILRHRKLDHKLVTYII